MRRVSHVRLKQFIQYYSFYWAYSKQAQNYSSGLKPEEPQLPPITTGAVPTLRVRTPRAEHSGPVIDPEIAEFE